MPIFRFNHTNMGEVNPETTWAFMDWSERIRYELHSKSNLNISECCILVYDALPELSRRSLSQDDVSFDENERNDRDKWKRSG